jgi:hypothetical protein
VKFTINAIYPANEDPVDSEESRSNNTAISMLRFFGWNQ